MLEQLSDVHTPFEGLKIILAFFIGSISLCIGLWIASYFYKFIFYGLVAIIIFSPILLIGQGTLKTWEDVAIVSTSICFLGGFIFYPFFHLSDISEKIKKMEMQDKNRIKDSEISSN